MIKKFLGLFSLLLILVLAYGLNQLRLAHADIDSLAPGLPTLKAVRESGLVFGLPTGIGYYNTATQRVPRTSVLDQAQDPVTDEGVMVDMSFPAFVVTWEDGRQFVIDAGFSAAEAVEFGRRSELAGSEPLIFHDLVANHLETGKVKGIGFTHLHTDHTMGASALCKTQADFSIVQTIEQYSWHNYLTSTSAELLNNLGCGLQLILDDGLILKSVGNFPGLYVVHVAGHTLGSQLYIVNVNQGSNIGTYILAGDMANHMDGIKYNISKPPAYSRWLVPENLEQLNKVRVWLKTMDQEPDITVLISHDKADLMESALPPL